jgi:hypothetical protein
VILCIHFQTRPLITSNILIRIKGIVLPQAMLYIISVNFAFGAFHMDAGIVYFGTNVIL